MSEVAGIKKKSSGNRRESTAITEEGEDWKHLRSAVLPSWDEIQNASEGACEKSEIVAPFVFEGICQMFGHCYSMDSSLDSPNSVKKEAQKCNFLGGIFARSDECDEDASRIWGDQKAGCGRGGGSC